MAENARDFFRMITSAAVPAEGEQPELRHLDHTYKPETGEIEWVALAEVQAVKTACERYANMSPLGPFEPDDEQYKRRLAFWVGMTVRGNECAFFFRAFSAATELKRKVSPWNPGRLTSNSVVSLAAAPTVVGTTSTLAPLQA